MMIIKVKKLTHFGGHLVMGFVCSWVQIGSQDLIWLHRWDVPGTMNHWGSSHHVVWDPLRSASDCLWQGLELRLVPWVDAATLGQILILLCLWSLAYPEGFDQGSTSIFEIAFWHPTFKSVPLAIYILGRKTPCRACQLRNQLAHHLASRVKDAWMPCSGESQCLSPPACSTFSWHHVSCCLMSSSHLL